MIDYTLNFWNSTSTFIGIVVGILIAVVSYKLKKQLTVEKKYQHEIKITEKINKLESYRSVILADVKKYNTLRTDDTNRTYYKQRAELYAVMQEYGIQFILMSSDENIPVGLIPFEWIKYIRDSDGEDAKPIIVCDFKGVKWYKNFKSPFKEINYVYKNSNYKENFDPDFMQFTTIKPNYKCNKK